MANSATNSTAIPAKEARKLHEAIEVAYKKLGEHRSEWRQTEQELKDARRAAENDAAIEDAATSNDISFSEASRRAQDRVVALERSCSGPVWGKRKGRLETELKGAESALAAFLTEHAAELDAELVKDRERIHKAISALLKQLAPLEREHDDITDTLAKLYGRTEGVFPEHIPTGDYPKPPTLDPSAHVKYGSVIERQV